MYISEYSCIQPGLKQSYIYMMNNDNHYNIKELGKVNKNLAREYVNAKVYGAGLGDFWRKAKKGLKKFFTSALKIAKPIMKGAQKALKFVANNETLQNVIEKVGNAVGPAIKVPGLGTIIKTGVKAADKVADGIENIINAIVKKNPSLTVEEAKKVVNTIKDTVEDYKKQHANEEEKKKLDENTKKVMKGLPDAISEHGIKKVQEAAGYLPFIDPSTITQKSRTGKGGRILKPSIRVIKPKVLTQYKDFFEKVRKLQPYKADVVGPVAGRIYLGSAGRVYVGGGDDSENEGCGIPNPKSKPKMKSIPKSEGGDAKSALQRLKAKLNN